MKKILTPNFLSAVKDYYYFLNKEYPQTALLKIVGDRYKLSKMQRTILYRGVVKKEVARIRQKKITRHIKGKILYIDGYNIILTIANYLYGKPLFISNDGFLRDAGESHGRNTDTPIFKKALEHLILYLKANPPGQSIIYLDSPVSRSGELASGITRRLKQEGLRGKGETVKSPDYLLKRITTGVIASSDSAVIERTAVKTADIARMILSKFYKASGIQLRQLL